MEDEPESYEKQENRNGSSLELERAVKDANNAEDNEDE